jgi:hypothetical protein
MAIHALWEDRYGLSIRKGPIDLTKFTGSGGNLASHDNDGTPITDSTVGGKHHFNPVDLSAGGTLGASMGMRTGASTSFIFGMPVIGNPDFSAGQETIEVQKTDGFATQRIGAANEASDIFRAGQNPSTSFDFVATGKSVVHAAAVFFQAGVKQDSTTANIKHIKFPNNTDGSDPIYYGSFLRKISTATSNSRMLSDGVGTSFTLRASQTEPLTCGLGMSGRLMITDFNVTDDINGALDESVIFGLDGKKNYLLQDSIITFEDAAGNHVALAAESIDFNCSAEVQPNRFNTFFPLNLVLGNYTIDGSFTIPALGKGTYATDVDGNTFQGLLADAGSGAGAGQSAYFTPRLLTMSWVTAMSGNPGDRVTLSVPAAAQDFQIRVNAIITDVSWGGDNEATMTISFRGMNQFTAGTDTIVTDGDAVKIIYYDDQSASWGHVAGAI